jgi:putative FmdB family regulatory protein
MPLYEYHCDSCDATVELLIRSPDETPECPQCRSQHLTKQLSVVAAPTTTESRLPVHGSDMPTCGRPQCQSGCMFE